VVGQRTERRLSDSRFQLVGQMNSSPDVLLGAIPEKRRRHNDTRKPDRISEHLRLVDDMLDYQRPAEDRLYRAGYEHKIKIIPTSSECIYAIVSPVCICHYFIFQHLVANAPVPP
jgi:hypothetical protein